MPSSGTYEYWSEIRGGCARDGSEAHRDRSAPDQIITHRRNTAFSRETAAVFDESPFSSVVLNASAKIEEQVQRAPANKVWG